MTTAVQVQYRRGTASQVGAFTGAQGEMVVDTTNNRVVVQDGATAGGWPAAKLSEVQTNTRTQVSDGNYTALTTDRTVAYISITAARVVSLPAASAFPGGSRLLVVDESGACSATLTITLAANGSDLIDGASSAAINSAYGYLALESNTFNKWTIIDQSTLSMAQQVAGAVAISGGTINGVTIGGSTPEPGTFTTLSANTLSLSRHAVSDSSYTVGSGMSMVAYTAITAARTVTLPASSSFTAGQQLLVVDESGACSATKTITLAAAGSDKVDGAASAVINAAYGYIAIESNGGGNWTIVDQGPQVLALNGLSGGVTLAATDGNVVSASGTTVSVGGPGGMVNKFRNGTMDLWQRGTSMTVTTSGGYTADGWIVLPTGASVTAAQAGGRLITKNSLQVTGAASVTDLIVKQRIESLIAAAFCSQTVTVQAQVYNGTGGAITPKLSVNRATGQDNGTYTNVDVNAVSLQSCPASAWTQISYTFSANANSYNGLEVVFDFGNNFGANTKTVQITECDIRVTPGATSGLNSNPPPPELRPVFAELPFCQRYYWQTTSTFNPVGYGGGNYFSYVSFPVTMRAAPTAANFSYGSSSNVSASSVSATSISNMTIMMSAGSSALAYELVAAGITLSAEL